MALPDLTSTDVPGILDTRAVGDVLAAVGTARPAISAMGGPDGAGASGLGLTYPVVTGRGTMEVQSAEKDAVAASLVAVATATEPLKTYAGGSDISLQALQRSTPELLRVYVALMASEWAKESDAAFAAALVAGADGSDTADAATFKEAAARAMVTAETVTLQPASAVLVASDVWPAIVAAADDGGMVLGRPVVHVPGLASGTAVVGCPAAATWHEDGPRLAAGEDVPNLGYDSAVYAYAAAAIVEPKGLVVITIT